MVGWRKGRRRSMGVSKTVIELFLSSVYFAIYFVVKHETFFFIIIYDFFLHSVLNRQQHAFSLLLLLRLLSFNVYFNYPLIRSEREREKIVFYIRLSFIAPDINLNFISVDDGRKRIYREN